MIGLSVSTPGDGGKVDVEVVRAGVEDVGVFQDLKQAEGKHDDAIAFVFLDGFRGEVLIRTDTAHADLAGVSRPVLGTGGSSEAKQERGHDERAKEQGECLHPNHSYLFVIGTTKHESVAEMLANLSSSVIRKSQFCKSGSGVI